MDLIFEISLDDVMQTAVPPAKNKDMKPLYHHADAGHKSIDRKDYRYQKRIYESYKQLKPARRLLIGEELTSSLLLVHRIHQGNGKKTYP
jgi:hypothetical protein